MGKHCNILVLAVLLCYCWLGSTQGQKPEAGKTKDPCAPWEVELRNHLFNASTIMPIMQQNRSDLYKISEKCISSFSPMSNLTVVRVLMSELRLVYDSLNPGSRMAIFKWIEGIYALKSSADNNSNKPPAKGDPSKGKDAKSSWITPDVLTLLDRFILQAPMSILSSLANTANSSICAFYRSNTTVWSRLYDLNAGQAKCLTDGLIKCGVNVTRSTVIPSLGQLSCFFTDKVEQMNPDAHVALRIVLSNCTRNVKDVYQKMLKNKNAQNLTSEVLESLGKAASGLNLAQISNISASTINQSLESLGKVNSWSMQQRRALANKVKVSEQDLSKMGALAAGISVKDLFKIPGKDIMKALNTSEDFANSTKAMSPAQRKTIVGAVLKDGDVNAILSQLPRNLVREIPLGKLKNVSTNVAEEMLKKNPNLGAPQVIALMKKVKLESLNNSKAIRDLNSGVRGLTCGNINQLNIDALRALGNSTFISPYQLNCAAKRFFKLMNDKGTFSLLTQEELAKIPASYLLYLPSLKALKNIPASLCPSALTLLGQADIKLQGRSSARRGEMLNLIKSCLNITDTKTLTADQAASLGSLVCTFRRDEITNLPSSIFQGILSQFMICGQFEVPAKEALRQKILSTFNATSTWTQDTLAQLGILAAVLNKEDLAPIPNTEDVKMALVGILTSAAGPKEGFLVPDFDNNPEMKFLAEKLSSIYSNPDVASSIARRRRAADCTNTAPNADVINSLGELNTGWTPEQLNCLTSESFMNALDTLSKVQGFSADQLTALKTKALQVYGNLLSMDQIAALKRITLAFTESEVTANFNGVDTDTLAEISGYQEWATSSYKSRSDTFMKYYLSNGKSMASLSDTDLVALGYFLCVQTPAQIQQVNSTAFSGAAMNIGKLMCPDISVLMAMKNKAVEAFGVPGTWTGEVCQELGTVTAGLTAAEITQLQEEAMPFLTPEAISLLPAKVFASLTPGQLRNLGPENSATISDQQRSSLSASQIEALSADSDSPGSPTSGSTLWTPASAFIMVALSLLVAAY